MRIPENVTPAPLRLAVKDNIDIKGYVTSAGSEYVAKNSAPAARDADCLTIARQRPNVVIVGKANLSEFAISPSGINEYFGTPKSPFSHWWRRYIPGGSSSGSATAITAGLADVALGTDTAGSIRTPAACSGIVGLKPTFGLVSLEGVFPVSPTHLDTVGPMGKDIAHVAIVSLGPKMVSLARVDELRRDPQALAAFPHASLEDVASPELLTDCANVDVLTLERE